GAVAGSRPFSLLVQLKFATLTDREKVRFVPNAPVATDDGCDAGTFHTALSSLTLTLSQPDR
ncbi:MAG TPA: hypothetical protein VKE94_13610, partial [Gemmataceae bacterium]|nr:hypothetical protein [Gemmataceae bacterium]